jgi:hypothetical protein
MVYHNQNYWGFGLSPSSGILGNRKHNVSETGGRKQIQFPKRRVFCFLDYRTMEKVQKPSNSDHVVCLASRQGLGEALGISFRVKETGFNSFSTEIHVLPYERMKC